MHHVQSATPLWLAYRIGVVEQCCPMLSLNNIFHKNCVILRACSVHGRGRMFSRGPLVDFSKRSSRGGQKW